jgi:DNA-binding MarR family transcriptional regulator
MSTHPDVIRAGIQFTDIQDQHIKENYVKVRELKGLWIPAEYLWADDLNPSEKVLMSFIKMADQKDHCWASNETLADWAQLTIGRVKNMIVELKKKGYLEQVSWDGRTKRVLRCLK